MKQLHKWQQLFDQASTCRFKNQLISQILLPPTVLINDDKENLITQLIKLTKTEDCGIFQIFYFYFHANILVGMF